MKTIFTSTFAAAVLGAAIVSAQAQAPQGGGQTQPGGQKPDTQAPGGGNTQPSTQTPSAGQADPTHATTTTYRGYLRKSPTGTGYTITPVPDRKTAGGAASTDRGAAGGGATVGTSGASTSYVVVAGPGAKADFATLADQCVEIMGMVAPTSGMQGGAGAAGNAGAAGGEVGAGVAAGARGESTARSTEGAQAGAAAGGAGATAGGTASTSRQQTLTVTTIRAAQGSCTE